MEDKRKYDDRRKVERRQTVKPGANVRYEDKDKPPEWRPKRMKRFVKQ